jgi:hypothetical protein
MMHRCKAQISRSIFVSVAGQTAKWLAHLHLTCKVAGSNLSEKFLNATQPSPHVKRVEAKSRGFSPGTPVSSHRVG